MKRRCLLLFVMLMVLVACSEKKDINPDERGSLYIASTVDITATRAEADVNQFSLILENLSNPEVVISGQFSDFPNGMVENVPVGSYELTLTSHPAGFTPAFEDPWYQGLKSQVPVSSGRTTMVSVECVQANAGITFIYDPSLAEVGLADIVPEMTQDDVTLYFQGNNREAKAYFRPKQVELKIKHGDDYLTIGGKKSQMLDLGKEQLWETTLKASQVTGKMSIIASVKVITEPTHFVEFELGESDPVEVTGVSIGACTSSFLAKGTDISSMRFGLYEKASLDYSLELGQSLEEFMSGVNGNELSALYLAQLNSQEGLLMNFDQMVGETEYSLVIMPVQNNMRKVQRYDFVSAEAIVPDPVQDPDGPIVPGTYSLNIYQAEEDGVYVDPYENKITLVKAKQKDTYLVNNLFDAADIYLVAEYNKNKGELTFTGKDTEEYDVFNDITLLINQGEFFGGIYLSDGVNEVDKLVFTVKDRKLDKATVAMQFRTFDPYTWEDLGNLEISPVNNPFTYVDSSTQIDRGNIVPMRSKVTGYPVASPRAATTRTSGKVELRSSVSVLQ